VAVRRRVKVSGRVQGVWYRESCRQVADEAGVSGWVRNNPDGTVEAALEGPPTAVDQVEKWMHQGPPRALVTQVEVRSEPSTNEHGFTVM
jgi:acylphosphatase